MRRVWVWRGVLAGLVLAACQVRGTQLATETDGQGGDSAVSQAQTVTAGTGSALPAEPDMNFGFAFEYSVCNLEVLDTFEQTYRRDVSTEPSVRIPVALTDEQMRAVYDMLVEIDFLSFPANYSVPLPESGTVAQVSPAYRYSLLIQNGGARHRVTWVDDIVDPNPPEAERLRELFRMMVRMVRAHPDVANLPAPGVACL